MKKTIIAVFVLTVLSAPVFAQTTPAKQPTHVKP